MAETARLLTTLAAQRVCVRHLVVNQIVESSNAPSYLERLRKGQDAIARRLLGRASAAVAADERAAPGAAGSDWAGVTVSPVAYYDLELRGVYPLRFLGERAFGAPQWAGFTGADGGGARRAGEDEAGLASGAAGCRFVVMGGKGGVGKTSSAAALALRCADAGLRTLIVSTDPAHSLGDVLQLSLAGRQEPVPVEDASHRRLFALEVDPDEAARAFQKLIRRLGSEADADGGGGGGEGGKGMLDGIAAQLGLADFASVLDTLPPGADELVALAKARAAAAAAAVAACACCRRANRCRHRRRRFCHRRANAAAPLAAHRRQLARPHHAACLLRLARSRAFRSSRSSRTARSASRSTGL